MFGTKLVKKETLITGKSHKIHRKQAASETHIKTTTYRDGHRYRRYFRFASHNSSLTRRAGHRRAPANSDVIVAETGRRSMRGHVARVTT